MRTTCFSLLAILCLALTASAQIYSEGPIDGNDNAFFVTGPAGNNFLGTNQDISNGFVAAGGNWSATDLMWAEWSVGAPTSFAYSFGAGAFGNELGSATVAQNASNTTLLFTNALGYGVYKTTVTFPDIPMTGGQTYWLTISNATDAAADGTQAWDIPNGGSGGPAICNFRQSGTNFGSCGLGGESFSISGSIIPPPSSTPEPSSIMLFGSGILGLAGVLRRKMTR
jgi:hypothetical protein